MPIASRRIFVKLFIVRDQEGIRMNSSHDFTLQMEGYGLTTAHILYRMPDFRSVLQTFLWQDYDLAPDFPQMTKFLDFWRANLDGDLQSVRFSHKRLIGPNEWRKVDGEFKLH
jgi:uncharacterized protein Usg